ncbi:S-adenosyl-L-methionine-dependent methyltransferase [Fomes fomentarius]|nr:S-adenosyl-L-methionine-dependent methyltransferase [Fomes fomentarius]
MTTLAHLRALHATIGSALDDIERVYSATLLDFPSPDIPLYKNDHQPSPSAEAQQLTNDPAVVRASNHIVAACGQLSHVVRNPAYTVLESIVSFHLPAAVQFLEASHTVEILRAAGSDGLNVLDLARKIDDVRSESASLLEPLDPSRLAHILRYLATYQIIREVRPDVFANNRVSVLFDSGATPGQLREAPLDKYDRADGVVSMIAMLTQDAFRVSPYLSEYFLTPRKDQRKRATVFNYAFDTDEQYYAFLERPENAFRLKLASRGMTMTAIAEGTGNVADVSTFPWDKLASNSLIVDVGGGVGHVSIKLAEAHSHLRFVVQDRARTIGHASAIWGDKHKDLFESGRVSFQAQDFFADQPQGLTPAVYVLGRVIHNWGDEECTKILAKLRAAATPETQLLIIEQILPLACAEDDSDDASTSTSAIPGVQVPPLAPANSRLLPNLGKAFALSYAFDLTFMELMNGKERTAREFAEIARAAGWKIVRIVRAEGSLFTYTTYVPI